MYDLLRNNLHVKAALNDVSGLQIHMEANSNERGAYFENTLQTAAHFGHYTIITLLLDYGAAINPLKGNPLRAAVERNHTEAALLLLQRGAQVNVPIGHHGSLLQGAVFNKQLEMVRLLLAWGAIVNEDLSKYGPPLEIASYRTDGNEDMLSTLIAAGAEVHRKDSLNSTPVESAAIFDHRRNVEYLLQHGAPGDRALKHAVQLKLLRVVQSILDRYPELLEIVTSTSWSPLTCAVSHGDFRMVVLLLSRVRPLFRHTLIGLSDRQHGTALELAFQNRNSKIFRILTDTISFLHVPHIIYRFRNRVRKGHRSPSVLWQSREERQ